jgi:alginate O-acetyltransferase complex protein AlgI
MDAASTGLNLFGFGVEPRILHLILPLGISFYTFETISYVVDVYLGRARPIRNPLDYALYIMFFPHLVAGPIVRPHEFLPQLAQSKRWSWTRLELGGRLFLLGFIKKAVIADRLAPVADMVFEKPEVFGSSAVWLGVLSYSVQIYCDFSGYSDMAIGLAHSLGFKLPRNFRLPYLSENIGEFWGRWHITLSTWLRDYLYIPLGGNRVGRWNTYRNLIVTMFLGGLWHGASWTFAAWGLYHGALLALHKALPRPAWLAPLRVRPVAVAMTFLSVCIGWVFFRAQSFADAALILERMFRPISGASIPAVDALIALSCLALVFFCHLGTQLVDVGRITRVVPLPVMGATFALLILFVQMFASIKNQTFIYFQF